MYIVSQLIIHLLCKWMSVSFHKQKTKKKRVKNQGSKPNSGKKKKKINCLFIEFASSPSFKIRNTANTAFKMGAETDLCFCKFIF